MNRIKMFLLAISLLTLSSCSNANSHINEKLLNEMPVEEVELDGHISVADFELVGDDNWLVPESFMDKGEIVPDRNTVAYEENLKLEEEILEKLKAHDIDTSNMYLMLNEENLILMWDSAAGKVYTYNIEKDFLQLVLETETLENYIPGEFTGKIYFLANVYEDNLYLIKDNILYIYNHVGNQISAKSFPENFEIVSLGNKFLQLKNGDEIYFYFYDDESLKSFDEKEFNYAYYYDYFISLKDNFIYAVDIINEKIYSYEVDGIEEIGDINEASFMVVPGKDLARILDFEKPQNTKEFKIILPKL